MSMRSAYEQAHPDSREVRRKAIKPRVHHAITNTPIQAHSIMAGGIEPSRGACLTIRTMKEAVITVGHLAVSFGATIR
jgi:hypothetical protein